MRAAIYARVSSETQASRGTIGSQLALLEAKVAEVGDDLVARFVDNGHSGTRLDRPGLDALRDGAQEGIFERVWVLTAELGRLGVEVSFTDSPPIADDPQARLLVQVQGVIAEYERAKMAERQRRGKLYKVRSGEAIFTKVPYGYRRVPRGEEGAARYEIFEPEAVVVRRIFDDYVAGGLSVRQLIRGLRADGISSPTGRPLWPVSTLGGMLRNSSYMGKAYWYRRESVPSARPTGRPTRQVARPREQWIEVAVPAIVSADTFEAAQRIACRNIAFSARRAPGDRWLLRGLVLCGQCGTKCACNRKANSRGAYNHYYWCAYQDELKAGGPERRCRGRNIRADELDAFVFDDGWDDTQTLWHFNSGLPNGFTKIHEAADKNGFGIGVWLSPWGGYSTAKKERIAAGEKAGYETVKGGFALSAPKYYGLFESTCLEMISKYGVNQFKFDGTGNASTVFPGSLFDSDFSAMIHLIERLRQQEPNIFINLSTGNGSPTATSKPIATSSSAVRSTH